MIPSVSEQAIAATLQGRQRIFRQNPMDRLPPHSIEAEQGVLGCLLLEPNTCIIQTVETLTENADVFYDLRHQTIYRELVSMADRMERIDLITVQQRLKDIGMLEQIGGIVYLNALQDAVPSAANLTYYLDIVAEKALLRRMIQTCTSIVGRVYEFGGDAETLVDEVEHDILSLRRVKTGSDSAKSLVNAAIDIMEQKLARDGEILGYSTGLADLDAMTDGMHTSEMITIAGYPSTGKTSLAMQLAFNLANNHRIPVGVFSGEMAPVKLMLRALCAEAKANARQVVESDAPRLTSAAGKLAKAPIYIERASGLTIGQIKAKARRMVQQHKVKLFVFDYIQLFQAGGDNREQQISNISKGIKAIAMELDCVCIALSQLTDDGKLKGARAIGEDTDSLWVLRNEGDWNPHVQPVVLNIDKCRDGETGKVPLTFIKLHTRFESAAKISDEDVPQ